MLRLHSRRITKYSIDFQYYWPLNLFSIRFVIIFVFSETRSRHFYAIRKQLRRYTVYLYFIRVLRVKKSIGYCYIQVSPIHPCGIVDTSRFARIVFVHLYVLSEHNVETSNYVRIVKSRYPEIWCNVQTHETFCFYFIFFVTIINYLPTCFFFFWEYLKTRVKNTTVGWLMLLNFQNVRNYEITKKSNSIQGELIFFLFCFFRSF